jgi:hypothetical protein
VRAIYIWIFRLFWKNAKIAYYLRHVCLSLRRKYLGCHWKDFRDILYWKVLLKSVVIIQPWFKSEKENKMVTLGQDTVFKGYRKHLLPSSCLSVRPSVLNTTVSIGPGMWYATGLSCWKVPEIHTTSSTFALRNLTCWVCQCTCPVYVC